MNATQSPTAKRGTIAYANKSNISSNASNLLTRKERPIFRCYDGSRIGHKSVENQKIPWVMMVTEHLVGTVIPMNIILVSLTLVEVERYSHSVKELVTSR